MYPPRIIPVLAYGRRVHQAIVPGAPALDIRDLYVAYPDTRRLALHGLNLTVPVGARLALLGHNGAGKSTLLKAIAGLLPVQRGSISIYGNPPGACHHRTAYLPQRGQIDWHFPISLRKLVMTGRYTHLGWLRNPTAQDWQIVDGVMAALGLAELGQRQIGQLSGGQQQRAMLARALAQEADLLLLDEPLNAVDAETRSIISQVLQQLHQQGKTLVVATHDISRLGEDYDLIFSLSDGRETALTAELLHG